MKKIYTILLGTLCISAMNITAQTVKIMKDGSIVAEYQLSEIDQVLFEPAATDIAQAVSGEYQTRREVTLPAMPQMGTVLSDEVEVPVVASSADEVSVALPTCHYVMSGTEMDLPAVTVKNVKVSRSGDAYTLAGNFDEEIGGKQTKVTFEGTVGADGTFTFTTDMNYGTMPFTLHTVYTNL